MTHVEKSMKLREAIRAVDNFQYELWEYDVFPTGKTTRRMIKVKTNKTNIRCLQHGFHHEKLVKGEWFIISEATFQDELNYFKRSKVAIRKNGKTEVRPAVKLKLVDTLMITDHARDRMEERFDLEKGQTKSFLESVLKDHFIVQNYEFYNGRYCDGTVDQLVVCSRDFKKILVLVPKNGRFTLATCYNPMDGAYSAFSDWFNDHLDVVHTLPTLEDYRGAV